MAPPQPASPRDGKTPTDRPPRTVYVVPAACARRMALPGAETLTWDDVLRGQHLRLGDYDRIVCGPVRYRSAPGTTQHHAACATLRTVLASGARVLFLLPHRDRYGRSRTVLRDATGIDAVPIHKGAAVSVVPTPECPQEVASWHERHACGDLLRSSADPWDEDAPRVFGTWVTCGRQARQFVTGPVALGDGACLVLHYGARSYSS